MTFETDHSVPPADVAAALLEGARLAYASDYVSFSGADEHGRVAFAIDTNRGRDGDESQAEHLYAVLHDEHAGWVDVAGTGRYPNPDRARLDLPDSAAFRFAGDPWSGLALRSEPNRLALEIDPLIERLRRAAAATLTWRGRRLRGRVTHEYLVRRDSNLMTRRSFSGLGEMQYHYLRTQDGDDVYVQSYDSGQPMAGMEPLLGFRTRDGATEQLRHITFTATSHALASGLYRWPTAWRVSFLDGRGRAELQLRTLRRQRVSTWFVAGLVMSSVVGGLRESDGREVEVHGFGELFATAPAVLWNRLAPSATA